MYGFLQIVKVISLIGISAIAVAVTSGCRTPHLGSEVASFLDSANTIDLQPGTFELASPDQHNLNSSLLRLEGGPGRLSHYKIVDEVIPLNGPKQFFTDEGNWLLEGNILVLISRAPHSRVEQTERRFQILEGGDALKDLGSKSSLIYRRSSGDRLLLSVLRRDGELLVSAIGREVAGVDGGAYQNIFSDVPCSTTATQIDCNASTLYGDVSVSIVQDVDQTSGTARPLTGRIVIVTSTNISYSANLLCNERAFPVTLGMNVSCSGQTQHSDL